MVAADSWDENSPFLEFETRDELRLQAVLSDQPLEKAALFLDGTEGRGMREVKIGKGNGGASFLSGYAAGHRSWNTAQGVEVWTELLPVRWTRG